MQEASKGKSNSMTASKEVGTSDPQSQELGSSNNLDDLGNDSFLAPPDKSKAGQYFDFFFVRKKMQLSFPRFLTWRIVIFFFFSFHFIYLFIFNYFIFLILKSLILTCFPKHEELFQATLFVVVCYTERENSVLGDINSNITTTPP